MVSEGSKRGSTWCVAARSALACPRALARVLLLEALTGPEDGGRGRGEVLGHLVARGELLAPRVDGGAHDGDGLLGQVVPLLLDELLRGPARLVEVALAQQLRGAGARTLELVRVDVLQDLVAPDDEGVERVAEGLRLEAGPAEAEDALQRVHVGRGAADAQEGRGRVRREALCGTRETRERKGQRPSSRSRRS